nr:hypothetical protein [uncultured archaeon]
MLIERLAEEREKSVSEVIRTLVNRSLDKIYEDTRLELERIDELVEEKRKELRELEETREHLHKVVEGEEEGGGLTTPCTAGRR